MHQPSTDPKTFWAGTNFLGQTKKFIYILCHSQAFFAAPFSKFGFCAGTKVFQEAPNAIKFLNWLKKFGPVQNILGPVEGQGKNTKS